MRYSADYNEAFVPIMKYTTLRMLLEATGKDQLVLKHLDVKTTYLYGTLDEEYR